MTEDSLWILGNWPEPMQLPEADENLIFIDSRVIDCSNWDVSNVTTMRSMFSCGSDFGVVPMQLNALDVSKWVTSACTNMSFLFYGCKGPGAVDVSGWDVSKVTTFDHMFSHSYLVIGDIRGWTNSIVENLECAFHSVQDTILDVSGFRTGNCISFGGMFKQYGSNLIQIIGLENFDTSAGIDFGDMFYGCSELEELNLSSFDTSNAKDGVVTSANGTTSGALKNMFLGMNKLKKITLGEKFSFRGDGTTTENIGVLPTPSAEYITGADGNWYGANGVAYAPADIPSNVATTYYAIGNMIIRYGTLSQIADAIRSVSGATAKFKPSEMAAAIAALKSST